MMSPPFLAKMRHLPTQQKNDSIDVVGVQRKWKGRVLSLNSCDVMVPYVVVRCLRIWRAVTLPNPIWEL